MSFDWSTLTRSSPARAAARLLCGFASVGAVAGSGLSEVTTAAQELKPGRETVLNAPTVNPRPDFLPVRAAVVVDVVKLQDVDVRITAADAAPAVPCKDHVAEPFQDRGLCLDAQCASAFSGLRMVTAAPTQAARKVPLLALPVVRRASHADEFADRAGFAAPAEASGPVAHPALCLVGLVTRPALFTPAVARCRAPAAVAAAGLPEPRCSLGLLAPAVLTSLRAGWGQSATEKAQASGPPRGTEFLADPHCSPVSERLIRCDLTTRQPTAEAQEGFE